MGLADFGKFFVEQTGEDGRLRNRHSIAKRKFERLCERNFGMLTP